MNIIDRNQLRKDFSNMNVKRKLVTSFMIRLQFFFFFHTAWISSLGCGLSAIIIALLGEHAPADGNIDDLILASMVTTPVWLILLLAKRYIVPIKNILMEDDE